jgi:hypothetical protein
MEPSGRNQWQAVQIEPSQNPQKQAKTVAGVATGCP